MRRELGGALMTVHAESSTGSKRMPNRSAAGAAPTARDGVTIGSREGMSRNGGAEERREAITPTSSPSTPHSDQTANPAENVEKAATTDGAALAAGPSADAGRTTAAPIRITPSARLASPRRLDNAHP